MNSALFELKALAFALSFSSLAVAESSVQLPVMIINSSQESRFDNGLNTTHWDEDDLQRSGQRELAQVLRATLGLSISQGMKGGPTSLSLRGASGSMGLHSAA